MKFLNEYRDPDRAADLARLIRQTCTRNWVIMEICGGQTHSIVRYGIDQMLPSQIELVHGPGCPVCVTPIEKIDRAIELSLRPEVIFCTFGDMLRVPGTSQDLFAAKALGADVRIVYSPLDALKIAELNPEKQVVFFAVGFETTAPANAMAVFLADKKNVDNFSLIVSHVLVPPAMESILSSPQCRVQGFLAAGHVCTVMGYQEYLPIAKRFETPIVITGFEPLDLLEGIYMVVKQLEENRHEVENQYVRSVLKKGNLGAQKILKDVFDTRSTQWRGIGAIKRSGYSLKPAYRKYDAELRFPKENLADLKNCQLTDLASQTDKDSRCISGLILQGLKKPHECPSFGNVCHPDHPLGAPMVSSEGACSSYWKYRRKL